MNVEIEEMLEYEQYEYLNDREDDRGDFQIENDEDKDEEVPEWMM